MATEAAKHDELDKKHFEHFSGGVADVEMAKGKKQEPDPSHAKNLMGFTSLLVFMTMLVSSIAATNIISVKSKLDDEFMSTIDAIAENTLVNKNARSTAAGTSLNFEPNICAGKKVNLDNIDCTDAVAAAIEQSGANVTLGYAGEIDNSDTSFEFKATVGAASSGSNAASQTKVTLSYPVTLLKGQSVSGSANLPANAEVAADVTASTSFDLDNNIAAGGLTTNVDELTFGYDTSVTVGTASSGSNAADQTTVTLSAAATVKAGQSVTGTNIAAGTTVAADVSDDTTLTLSKDIETGGLSNSATLTIGDAGSAPPITTAYGTSDPPLCPVNVHWHLGAEHLSVGQYDEKGVGPYDDYAIDDHRRLASGGVRIGHQCGYYDSTKEKYTKEYDWEHCVDMQVGQTYEIHWPHSSVGACGTPYQYQTPFYDGVFCNFPAGGATTHNNVGVQAQVFTVVNDESYYYPDLIKGMIVAGDFGQDIAIYTGSTTGTSRQGGYDISDKCSAYSPITWQVDRKCHLISASSFDKMCADMKSQVDDMSDDLYAHGSREVVAKELAALQVAP